LNVFIPKYNSQNTLYQVFDKINLPCRVIRGALNRGLFSSLLPPILSSPMPQKTPLKPPSGPCRMTIFLLSKAALKTPISH